MPQNVVGGITSSALFPTLLLILFSVRASERTAANASRDVQVRGNAGAPLYREKF
jgi:hypothetical protein